MSAEPMTLDFAIQHALEASRREDLCESCREEHEQLAGWLMELREIRADRMPHGYWIYRGTERGYFCSNCGGGCLLNYESDWHESTHCPHCGAKMDGEAHDKSGN